MENTLYEILTEVRYEIPLAFPNNVRSNQKTISTHERRSKRTVRKIAWQAASQIVFFN